MLGIGERELAAIFTVQTAGEVLNYHQHLHGFLADGYWKAGVFTRFSEVARKAIEEAFAERVLGRNLLVSRIDEFYLAYSPFFDIGKYSQVGDL